MKSIKNKAGVSPIIAILLLVAITVAIGASTYLYISNFTESVASESPLPEVRFLKYDDYLVVSSYDGQSRWENVSVNGTASLPNATTTIDVGDIIDNCRGRVILTLHNELIGTYEFD